MQSKNCYGYVSPRLCKKLFLLLRKEDTIGSHAWG